MLNYRVSPSTRKECAWLFINHHYAGRMPAISHVYGLYEKDKMVGAISFGVPGSRHLQVGVCPSSPGSVIELNRLCVLDSCLKNTESWFIARALKMLPPFIVVSYADTIQGHMGYVYRAANFSYAGWTDMDRKTARYDYVVPGKHSRDAFRGGAGAQSTKVRRLPKVKYWTVTGDAREKKQLLKLCAWPSICWKKYPPPSQHTYLKIQTTEAKS